MLLLTMTALAGERTFAFSYGYGTVPKGGIEVEHYATATRPEGAVGPSWQHQLELEYGITDRLEGGLYLVAEQGPGEPLAYSGYKARLRYRFGAQGVGPVDVGMYAEYIGSASGTEHAGELKLIVAKDVESFVSALNVEYKLTVGEELEHEIEPTLGLGYRIQPWFALGAEGKAEFELGEEVESLFFVGPSVHLAGEGGVLWWTVAALAPLNAEAREHDGVIVRSLIAVNL